MPRAGRSAERARFPLLRTLGAAVGGLLVLWLASLGLVVAAGATPELRSADAILVLGAAHYNGRPSPVYQARLDYALELYRMGLAPRLIFTGGQAAGDTVSEGEVGRRYALANGVPASAILFERKGRTTSESVSSGAALMRSRGMQRALIVSDPFHVLRVELLARKAGLIPHRAPTPYSPIMKVPELRRRYILGESLRFPATALVLNR